jgi:hypothetical protein
MTPQYKKREAMPRDVRQVRISHAVTEHHDVHDGALVVRGHLDRSNHAVVVGVDEQDPQNVQRIVFKDGEVRILGTDGSTLHTIIHTGSTFSLSGFTIEGNERKRLEPGATLRAGTSLQIAESPNPVVMVDADGNLISRTMYDSLLFDPYVMGNTDSSKPDAYAKGLIRAGAAYTPGDTPFFLRKDGNRAAPVSNSYSGVVSSVFTELTDTPNSYSGEQNRFLKCVDPGKLEFAVPSTDELSEGSTNQFFTKARVAAACADGVSLGAVVCQSVQVLSDRREKQNISKPIDPEKSLATIVNLQPKSYQYTSQPEEDRLGLISQEVPSKFVREGPDNRQRILLYDLVCEIANAVRAIERRIRHIPPQVPPV